MMMHTLYYVHDPMCSWCWGFRPAWLAVLAALPPEVVPRYVLGGLAADTEAPMPADMQARIRATWQRIQQEIPGTQFNYEFWELCRPRRSTYASCRAVIAAEKQRTDCGTHMLLAIQEAYYLQARNPSDTDVLTELAEQVGLDPALFATDLCAAETQTALNAEFELRDRLGVHSFPGLVLALPGEPVSIPVDYNNPANMLSRMTDRLAQIRA